jgi:hypothetical protein
MGKTTEIIKIAAENYSYIVCLSHRECARVAKYAEELGLKIPFPMTMDEFMNGRFYRPGIKGGFVIDNAEAIIQRLAKGVTVRAMSVNEEG